MFFGSGYLLYIIISLPALLLGLWAQSKIKSSYNKYSRVRTTTGLTGAEVARRMLDQNGLQSVRIEQVAGNLSDHYDPRKKYYALAREYMPAPVWLQPGSPHTNVATRSRIRKNTVHSGFDLSWCRPFKLVVGWVLSFS